MNEASKKFLVKRHITYKYATKFNKIDVLLLLLCISCYPSGMQLLYCDVSTHC